jgi:hypothetical protein
MIEKTGSPQFCSKYTSYMKDVRIKRLDFVRKNIFTFNFAFTLFAPTSIIKQSHQHNVNINNLDMYLKNSFSTKVEKKTREWVGFKAILHVTVK